MTNFLKKILIFFVISFCCIMVLFYLLLLLPNQYTKASHEMNLVYSINRLKELKYQPKIIILGGSGCGFGINSELLFLYFKRPVVNTGTHAGIGLRLQLELFKEYINDGDIVIIIPEYQQYKDRFYYGNTTALRILSCIYPAGFKSISLKQWCYLHKYIPETFIDALSIKGYKDTSVTPYSKKLLNKFGDVTGYTQRKHTTEVPLDEDLSMLDVDMKSIELMHDFKEFVKTKNATLLLFPPAYQQASFLQNRCFITLLERELNRNDCPFETSPVKYAFKDSLFFDTPYHLTGLGTEVRTRMLINDIDRNLAKNK